MPYVKIKNYREIPFSAETPNSDFYKYADIKHLVNLNEELYKLEVLRCRTIGILYSDHGKFYLYDMDSSGVKMQLKILLSMAYLKTRLRSSIMPQPVQVFGTLEWKNVPVIYVRVLQELTVPLAIRTKDIMSLISKEHLAKTEKEDPT